MAVRACETKILVEEWDFSGQSNQVNVDLSVGVLDYATFQNCFQQRIPGLPAGQIGHDGYYVAEAAGNLEYEMYARLAAANDVIVAAILGTEEATPVAYVLPTSYNQQLRLTAPVENILTVQGNWSGNNTVGVRRGLQVALGEAIDSTGALDGIDFGAAGSAGGVAYLFVQSITGSATDATIDVESDSDSGFGTAASEGTFTFSAVGATAVTLSGTVNRYIRANVTDLGGADDITFLMVVCIDGVTQ